jgi:DNA-binding GntR family transcriptional regulator
MRNAPLQERRNRQILADLVRTYIETGEPVSSRAISKSYEETLSPATIRNVMADLEDGGYLYSRTRRRAACRRRRRTGFFAQEIAIAGDAECRGQGVDPARIRRSE